MRESRAAPRQSRDGAIPKGLKGRREKVNPAPPARSARDAAPGRGGASIIVTSSLRSFARKILKDPEDLEDVVQEFFLNVCPNEEEKKPYGRVSYIKGKSLIFYGFRFKGD